MATADLDRAELKRLLPLLQGKVQLCVAKKDKWTEKELNDNRIQFGPSSFNYRDVIAFSEIFSLVDADCSGQISAEEVKRLMGLLGEDADMADVEHLVHEFDVDGSGEIDLTEFILVLALQRRSDFHKDDVIRAFDMFAKSTQLRKGVVNKDVLRHALIQYGSSIASEQEISKLVESLPMPQGDTSNEFDYAKHISQYLS